MANIYIALMALLGARIVWGNFPSVRRLFRFLFFRLTGGRPMDLLERTEGMYHGMYLDKRGRLWLAEGPWDRDRYPVAAPAGGDQTWEYEDAVYLNNLKRKPR